MLAGIANCFMTDVVDFVKHNWVPLGWLPV